MPIKGSGNKEGARPSPQGQEGLAGRGGFSAELDSDWMLVPEGGWRLKMSGSGLAGSNETREVAPIMYETVNSSQKNA